MSKNESKQVNAEEAVLIEYLMVFLPAGDGDDNMLLKSSQEIQGDLSDMAELSINQITSIMRDTGYHIKVDGDSRPKWMMLHKS